MTGGRRGRGTHSVICQSVPCEYCTENKYNLCPTVIIFLKINEKAKEHSMFSLPFDIHAIQILPSLIAFEYNSNVLIIIFTMYFHTNLAPPCVALYYYESLLSFSSLWPY